MGSVQLENVTKRYSDVVAVDDMDVDIDDGEFICLVGPSGCGKSTTLEMIGGLTKPTKGRVIISDRDVTDLPPKDRGLAMVFQNIALFPHMDVYDNISYGLRLRDFPTEEIDERVEEAAEILQIEGMLDRMPSELSGGQRQRVAIGRAIVRDPDVFLMDEPLANLDAKLRVHMRTELQRLQRQLNVTTIYVTHDQEEAMTMADRIAVINNGVLQQIAPPLTCYNEPANLFVAGFIGSPSMNFFEGRSDGDRLRFGSFDIDVSNVGLPEDLENITLGVRQEDIYPAEQSESVEAPSQSILAKVDVLEPVGEQIFAYLDVGIEKNEEVASDEITIGSDDESLLMGVEPDFDIAEDDELEIVFDRSQIHFFKSETGEAVTHGATAKQVIDESQ